MTVNTRRNNILNVCKYCRHYVDRGKNRYRHQCFEFGCSVYEAHECRKTHSIRKQAPEMCEKAAEEAYLALTGGHE